MVKKQNKGSNIFIYQCLSPGGCSGLIMMHHPTCQNCGQPNNYYDEKLEVDKLDDQDAAK